MTLLEIEAWAREVGETRRGSVPRSESRSVVRALTAHYAELVFDRKLCATWAFALLASSACACGDASDIQLPLPEPAPPSRVPVLPRARARAFANIGVRAVSDACPVEFNSVLPPAPPIASGSASNRVVDGDGARVECLVRQRQPAAAVFDVALTLEHEDVPAFSVRGGLSRERAEPVALHLTVPDGNLIESECPAETISIAPGEVALHVSSCEGSAESEGSTGCSIEVVVIFENCER